MKLNMRMEQRLFPESQLQTLLKDALTVWRQSAFRIHGTDEWFDYLRSYGCHVDGELVRFPNVVVDKVMARAGEEKRRRQAETPGPEPATELRLYTHGQALHICDLESNRIRPALEADLTAWCHAVDRLGDVERSHPTFIPTDAPLQSADLHAFATIALHSRRPHRVSVYSARMLPFFIETCRIVKGTLEKVRQEPVFATKCWVNSPFMITRESLEVAMAVRRQLGVPITFGQMPVAGGAGPITVAGSLVQNTAESLALCAMRLAIDDRIHEIEPTSAFIDMRDACQRQNGPDLFLHRVAGADMNRYIFGGSATALMPSSVSAPVVSPQSVFEKALYAGFNFACGNRDFGLGSLSASDVGSPVQLMIDYELAGYFRHLLRDVSGDAAHIGLATMLTTIPQGARFMENEHTARFFREECWFSALVDHRAPLAWANNPSDLIVRARERARDWFGASENQCPLSESQRRDILAVVAEADRLIASDKERVTEPCRRMPAML